MKEIPPNKHISPRGNQPSGTLLQTRREAFLSFFSNSISRAVQNAPKSSQCQFVSLWNTRTARFDFERDKAQKWNENLDTESILLLFDHLNQIKTIKKMRISHKKAILVLLLGQTLSFLLLIVFIMLQLLSLILVPFLVSIVSLVVFRVMVDRQTNGVMGFRRREIEKGVSTVRDKIGSFGDVMVRVGDNGAYIILEKSFRVLYDEEEDENESEDLLASTIRSTTPKIFSSLIYPKSTDPKMAKDVLSKSKVKRILHTQSQLVTEGPSTMRSLTPTS